MGVMAREQSGLFVITSDRTRGDVPSKTAPKKPRDDVYQVWTGDRWSAITAEAKTFDAIEEADDYIRENSARVMQNG